MALTLEAEQAVVRILQKFTSTVRAYGMKPHPRVLTVGSEEVNGIEGAWLGNATGEYPTADVRLIYENYAEAGKKQQACRDCEPGAVLRAVTLTPRMDNPDLWLVQPAYYGVGPCGLTTVHVPRLT